MATSTARIGTFDELLAGTSPEVAAIMREARRVVVDTYPTSFEEARLGDRAASYGVGPRKMLDGYAYLSPKQGYVNLGFYEGAVLPDPTGLLEGTGKGLRHIKLRRVEDVDTAAVRDLLRAAIARRQVG